MQKLICALLIFMGLTTREQVVPLKTTSPTGRHLSDEQWRDDLRLADQSLRNRHPHLFHTMQEPVFEQALTRLSDDIPGLNDDEITVRLMHLLTLVNDGHTGVNIEFRAGLTHIPLRVTEFSDGLYIRAAAARYGDLAGARILAIGGVPWEEAVRQIKELIPCDPGNNGQQSSWPLSLLVTDPLVLHGLRLAATDKAVTYTVERDGERPCDITLESSVPVWGLLSYGAPDNWVDAQKGKGVQAMEKPWRAHYAFAYIPEYKVLYFQFNNIGEEGGETLAAFTERMIQATAANTTERMVIDLRQNPGGDNSLLRPLLIALIRSRLNHRGGLYILTGPVTFSAAQNFVNRLEAYTDCIVVGEPTSQNINFFANPVTVTLPKSQLNIDIASEWWQDADPRDKRTATFPEVFVPAGSFTDYVHGKDPALEFSFQAPVPASFEEWMSFALPKGEDSAMQQYNGYVADPHHRYPGNLQKRLDAFGRQLLEQHHDEWALAAFQVNVRLHPDEAGLFYSLGDGYAALNRNEEAVKAYHRCIELDPGYWQARQALGRLSQKAPSQ